MSDRFASLLALETFGLLAEPLPDVHAELGSAWVASRHSMMRGAFEKNPDRFV